MRGESISRPPTSDWFVFIHAGGLHGVPITLSFGLSCERAAQQRQDLLAVVRDREVPQAVVGLAGRHVVVGVVRALDEVGRAHRLAQERQLVVGEQAAHGGVALRLAQPVEDARARVGDRGAEAVHGLVAPARVDADRQRARAAGVEVDRPAVVHLLGAVGRRHPHPGGRRRRR